MQCFITWSQDEAQILRTTEQQVNSPLAMFMEGNARVVQEDVSDDDQFGSSQQSTQVPERDSEDEEDVSVMMSGGPIMGPPEIPFHHLEEDNVPGPDQTYARGGNFTCFCNAPLRSCSRPCGNDHG